MTAHHQSSTQGRRTRPNHIRSVLLFSLLIATSLTAKPPETLEELRDMPLTELSSVDIIRMNLIVAKEIEPDIGIPAFERLMDAIAAHVRQQIEINEPFFVHEKAIFGGCREKWIVTVMWSVFTEDFGIHYLEGGNDALDHGRAWQKFIHGPLTAR